MQSPNPSAVLEAIFDSSSNVAFSGRDGVIEWVSNNISALLGWTPGELMGRGAGSLLHPEDADAIRRLRAAAQHGEWAEARLRLRHQHGNFVRVDVRMGPMKGDDPGSGVVGVLRGRDGQSDMGNVRVATVDAFQALAKVTGDVVFTVGTAGVVLTVTPSIERLLGWRPDELITAFLPALVHPDDRGRVSAFRRAVQAGSEPPPIEIRVQARGGDWRWVSAAGVLMNGDDEKPSVVVVWRDIDDLVHIHQVAQKESERLRASLDCSLDPRVTLTSVRDDAGRIVDFRFEEANRRACEFLNLARDRLIGMRLLDVAPADAETGMFDAYARTLEAGTFLEIDEVLLPHGVTGAARRYDIRAYAVDDSLMLTWRDVTNRSRAADEMTQAAIQFGTIARHAGDLVAHVVGGIIVWCSGDGRPLPQFRTGGGLDDAIDALAGSHARDKQAQMSAAFAAGTPYIGVWNTPDTAGRRRDLLVRAECHGPSKELQTEIILVITDVTGTGWNSEHAENAEDTQAPNGDR